MSLPIITADQRLAERHARGGALQPQAGGREHGLGHGQLALQHLQRQPGVAQRAAHIQVVTRAGARA